MKELERLLELAGKATPGPWRVDPMMGLVVTDDGSATVAKSFDWPECRDADFIAAANPAVVKALVETVQAGLEVRKFGSKVEATDGRMYETRQAKDFDAALSRLADALKGQP